MATVDKLIKRLKTVPKDFTFDELKRVFEHFGFLMLSKGKTSGSAVKFVRNRVVFKLHKPHPRKELLEYQIKDVLTILRKEDLI